MSSAWREIFSDFFVVRDVSPSSQIGHANPDGGGSCSFLGMPYESVIRWAQRDGVIIAALPPGGDSDPWSFVRAAGAFPRDNFAYMIGRRFSPAINRG